MDNNADEEPARNTRNNRRIRDFLLTEDGLLDENAYEPPTKKKKSTNVTHSIPRLLDGKYFSIVRNDDSKITAKCMICGRSRKGDLKSTGNFMDHFTSCHPNLVNEVNTYKRQRKSTVPTTQTLITTFSSHLVRIDFL